MVAKRKKGMGIKTSVKSGNFRATKKGAGMTKKGVKAYRKANPGSKLQTAVTEKSPSKSRAKRRKSYCARSFEAVSKYVGHSSSQVTSIYYSTRS